MSPVRRCATPCDDDPIIQSSRYRLQVCRAPRSPWSPARARCLCSASTSPRTCAACTPRPSTARAPRATRHRPSASPTSLSSTQVSTPSLPGRLWWLYQNYTHHRDTIPYSSKKDGKSSLKVPHCLNTVAHAAFGNPCNCGPPNWERPHTTCLGYSAPILSPGPHRGIY